jgi:AraC-like DNA-binding protein
LRQLKVKLEAIQPDADSSFKILLTPRLNELFYWHFHPEYEIVYVEASNGIRHIGDHISRYAGSDLALIGPNIPHLNFDYGLKEIAETVVVQMKAHFLGVSFFSLPEIASINDLFERAKSGLAFYGHTKIAAGAKLKTLTSLGHFDQLICLLQVFQLLASSGEYIELNARPISTASVLKEQQRLHNIYHYIETSYTNAIDVNTVAALVNLSTPAFCRYFKKSTRFTFTDFVNQYRINQSKKLLLQHMSVTDACYESGFENLSHFNKTFKKFAGENPTAFKKRQVIN